MDPVSFATKVTKWAKCDNRVVAALVCGSHARNRAHADSDLDFILIAPEPISLLDNRAWLGSFGRADVVRDEDWGLVQSIRAYYGTLEVEFGIAGLEWAQPPIDSGTARVMLEPTRILYDPEHLLERAIAEVRLDTK